MSDVEFADRLVQTSLAVSMILIVVGAWVAFLLTVLG